MEHNARETLNIIFVGRLRVFMGLNEFTIRPWLGAPLASKSQVVLFGHMNISKFRNVFSACCNKSVPYKSSTHCAYMWSSSVHRSLEVIKFVGHHISMNGFPVERRKALAMFGISWWWSYGVRRTRIEKPSCPFRVDDDIQDGTWFRQKKEEKRKRRN